jgi:hypothetical protein
MIHNFFLKKKTIENCCPSLTNNVERLELIYECFVCVLNKLSGMFGDGAGNIDELLTQLLTTLSTLLVMSARTAATLRAARGERDEWREWRRASSVGGRVARLLDVLRRVLRNDLTSSRQPLRSASQAALQLLGALWLPADDAAVRIALQRTLFGSTTTTTTATNVSYPDDDAGSGEPFAGNSAIARMAMLRAAVLSHAELLSLPDSATLLLDVILPHALRQCRAATDAIAQFFAFQCVRQIIVIVQQSSQLSHEQLLVKLFRPCEALVRFVCFVDIFFIRTFILSVSCWQLGTQLLKTSRMLFKNVSNNCCNAMTPSLLV